MDPKHFRARPFNRHADWPSWLTSEEKAWGSSGMYRFYGTDQQLLYVGISRQMEVRWSAHRNTSKWWSQVEYVAVSFFPEGCGVWPDLAEKASIAHEDPPFNSNHRRPAGPQAEALLPYLPPPGFEVDG